MHLADAFIQSDLQLHSGYTFSLVRVFPGNQTHNLLRCWRNALPLSHTGTHTISLIISVTAIPTILSHSLRLSLCEFKHCNIALNICLYNHLHYFNQNKNRVIQQNKRLFKKFKIKLNLPWKQTLTYTQCYKNCSLIRSQWWRFTTQPMLRPKMHLWWNL